MDNLQEKIRSWNYGQEIKVDASLDVVRPNDNKQGYMDSSGKSAITADSIVNYEAPKKNSSNYYHIKTVLHQKILGRLNLGAAETMSRTQLSAELKNLIDVLVAEESIQVNHVELKK